MTGLGTLKGQRFFCFGKGCEGSPTLLCAYILLCACVAFLLNKYCIQIVEVKYQLQFFLRVIEYHCHSIEKSPALKWQRGEPIRTSSDFTNRDSYFQVLHPLPKTDMEPKNSMLYNRSFFTANICRFHVRFSFRAASYHDLY